MDRCWLSDVHSCLKFLCLRNPCKLFYFVPFQFLIPYIFAIIVISEIECLDSCQISLYPSHMCKFSYKHEHDAWELKIYFEKAMIKLQIPNMNRSVQYSEIHSEF